MEKKGRHKVDKKKREDIIWTVKFRSACTYVQADLTLHCPFLELLYNTEKLQNLNPDGSFTLADSNYFSSPWEILPTVQENKYLAIF